LEEISLIVATISMVVAVAACLLEYYLHVYAPRRVRPRIVYSADHYFITESIASHDYLIYNEGNSPAKDVKLYLAFLPRFKIIDVFASPPPSEVKEGKGHSRVELRWDQILPKNLVFVSIRSEADKREPLTAFPIECKLWYERGVVSAYEAKPIHENK
jgi:hypothetical protein